jgi:hypothetical protein
MASADTIILDLYRSGEIRKACLTITGSDPLWRDLEQECVLILLEKDPAKILQIHEQGYFKFYVVRLLLNLYRGKEQPVRPKVPSPRPARRTGPRIPPSPSPSTIP